MGRGTSSKRALELRPVEKGVTYTWIPYENDIKDGNLYRRVEASDPADDFHNARVTLSAVAGSVYMLFQPHLLSSYISRAGAVRATRCSPSLKLCKEASPCSHLRFWNALSMSEEDQIQLREGIRRSLTNSRDNFAPRPGYTRLKGLRHDEDVLAFRLFDDVVFWITVDDDGRQLAEDTCVTGENYCSYHTDCATYLRLLAKQEPTETLLSVTREGLASATKESPLALTPAANWPQLWLEDKTLYVGVSSYPNRQGYYGLFNTYAQLCFICGPRLTTRPCTHKVLQSLV